MRFSAVAATTVIFLASIVLAQDPLFSALGSAVTSAVESARTEGVTAISVAIESLLWSALLPVPSGSAETTTLGVNATSTFSSAHPTSSNATHSTGAAMGLGVNVAQYILPGVAAVGAVLYSGFFGL